MKKTVKSEMIDCHFANEAFNVWSKDFTKGFSNFVFK